MMLPFAGCGPKLSSSDTSSTVESKIVTGSDEKVTLRVMDSSDSTSARRKVFNDEFTKRHPNVTIEYTCLTIDQLKTTVVAAIKAGNAPDVFPLISGMKLSTAVSEGWYLPISDYLSEDYFSTFSDGVLNEGITTIDGKVYFLPECMNIVNSLMFYNKTVFQKAGLDPNSPPKTWSEFIKYCDTITKAGNGNFYGMIEGAKATNRDEIAVRAFANLAGAKCNDIGVMTMVDGKNVLNSQGMKDAMNLYATLAKNGDFYPDSVNLTAPEARALFAQDKAGFIVQGSWCIATWAQNNPDLNYGVMATPVPDSGAKGGLPYTEAQPWMGINAKSKHPDVAAQYLKELFGSDYQGKIVSDGGFVSAIKGVNEKYMENNPLMKQYYELSQTAGKLSPDPIIGNVACADVYTEAKAISPNLGAIVQGVIAASITDPSAELDKLASATQTEWERAIKVVADKGASVSKADFEFKNWNPLQDYKASDYANHK